MKAKEREDRRKLKVKFQDEVAMQSFNQEHLKSMVMS
jgi:hypothetical protein